MYNNRSQNPPAFEPTDEQLDELHKNLPNLTTAISRRLTGEFNTSAELIVGPNGGIGIGFIIDGGRAGMQGHIQLEERMFPEDAAPMPDEIADDIANDIVAGAANAFLENTDGGGMTAM